MGDTWKKVSGGESLQLSAKTYNAFVDVARWYAESQSAGASVASRAIQATPFIKVENGTGQDLDAGSVVAVSTPIFNPTDNAQSLASFRAAVWLRADIATPGAGEPLAILLEAIPRDRIGMAAVAGMWPVILSVQNANDKRADVTDGDPTKLTTGSRGPFQIVCGAEETGERNGYVAFSGTESLYDFQIRNDTGQDLVKGQIVGIGEYIDPTTSDSDFPAYFTDYDEDETGTESTTITMTGVLPEARKHNGAFAVLTADIASGDTGPAITTGVAKCTVDFSRYPTCKFAEIDQESPTVDSLTAYPIGSAQILARNSDDTCVVKLANFASRRVFAGVLTEDLEYGGTAQCTLTVDDNAITIEVGVSARVLSNGETIKAGSEVNVSGMDGRFLVISAQCTPENEEEEE